MKKLFCALLAILMLVMMISPVTAADRGKALVVHGGADSVGVGDKAVGDRLKSLGFGTVDYIYAKNSTDTSFKGYSVVFIGESVSSADVATKFTNADCFVICGEPGLWDELLIGKYNTTYDSTPYKGKYILKNDIIKCGLTSFEGFKAEATPGFLESYGAGVKVIVANDAGDPAITYTAKGGELVDKSSAAGARSTIFCRGQSAADFTDESWKVFDALVNYALPLPAEKPAVKTAAATADTTGIIIAAALMSLAGALTIIKRR